MNDETLLMRDAVRRLDAVLELRRRGDDAMGADNIAKARSASLLEERRTEELAKALELAFDEVVPVAELRGLDDEVLEKLGVVIAGLLRLEKRESATLPPNLVTKQDAADLAEALVAAIEARGDDISKSSSTDFLTTMGEQVARMQEALFRVHPKPFGRSFTQ